MAMFDQHLQQVDAQYNAEHITVYAQATSRPVDPQVLVAAEQQLAALPLETIPDPAPLPEGSRMPFSRNPLFVGREADLLHLAQVLKGKGIAAIGQIVAATGLGGLGKTQLAVEFVHRYGQYFIGGIFWLTCATPETIPHELAACGGAGGMQLRPDFHALPLEEQVRGVQRAWQSPLPRLLVFDNCEDETLLTQWRPPHGGCRVLVTTRRGQWETTLGIHLVPLGVLQRDESLALMRHHCSDLSADEADLDAIAEELGDLPLALHLAGSFLVRYRHAVTPAMYLVQLRQPDILAHDSLQGRKLTRELSPTQHEQHVARTFTLSYDRLDSADATDAHALALLARAACFALSQPIPRDLLFATVTWGPETSNAAVQAEDALGRLLDLGLLESEAPDSVRLHRLLAVFVRAVVREVAAQSAVEDVLLVRANHLIGASYLGPLLALQPHLRAVTEAAQPRQDARTADLETILGKTLYQLVDYAGAQPSYERALTLREQLFGPNHPDVATSLNHLAELYRALGRYAEAEPLYQRALTLRERGLGPDHPDVAQSLHNLAILYWTQGRYAEAEPLYQRALTLRERRLGPDHSDVAESLNDLAILYQDQGRYAEAEPLYQHALALRERGLGPDHPDVAQSLNNLAGLFWAQGRYEAAEPLYVRALTLYERVLGPDHPVVATSLNNLALLYRNQRRYAEAEPLHQRALALREQTLGPEHPDVAQSLHNLAGLYQVQGRCAEAEPLYQRALTIREQTLGPDHPDVAATLNNLATLYHAQERYAEVEPLLHRALAMRERVLGPAHPGVATSLNHLVELYRALGRYAEAEPFLQQALTIREQRLGLDHPDVVVTLKTYIALLKAMHRNAEAAKIERRVLVIETERLTKSPSTY